MYNSDHIDEAVVIRFKNSIRPTLSFPMSKLDRLALAVALEELAVELRQEGSTTDKG